MTTMRFIPNVAGLALLLVAGSLSGITFGQEKSPVIPAPTSSCSRDNALEIIQQQIEVTKTFDDPVQRIAVLIRAADLLWNFRPNKSRAALTEAFDLAVQTFKLKGVVPEYDGKMLIGAVDHRYEVISAIAKHDIAWAKKLTEQILKEQQQEADDKLNKDKPDDAATAERLLTMAGSMLPSNLSAALSFGRNSLRYPATFYLSMFLYQLAAADKSAADGFYQEALAAYAAAPMERLLYLSSYPFGNDREAGEMPGYTVYRVPSGFAPNRNLQRVFVQTLLRRVQEFIANPSDPPPSERLSEPGQMLLALTRLAGQIQKNLPDLAAAIETAKGNLIARIPQDSQRKVDSIAGGDDMPAGTFDERVEAALKNPNVDVRDQELTFAITGSAATVALDIVLSAVDKISDSTIRQPLLDWLYFDRAQRAITERKLEEARRLAAKVDELDQRTYLYARIAEELLKQNTDQTQARDVLDEVVAIAAKAPNTPVTARALLEVAYLYTKIDMNRAVAVMAEAVKCINRIEHPDFTRQFVTRKIEGKNFGTYTGIDTPGFTPENAFREIGKIDFDGMLNLVSNFSDKFLRANNTLALVEGCLEQKPKPRAPAEKSKTRPAKIQP
jgi:tetratricopeptide (TPR) repeat protein